MELLKKTLIDAILYAIPMCIIVFGILELRNMTTHERFVEIILTFIFAEKTLQLLKKEESE